MATFRHLGCCKNVESAIKNRDLRQTFVLSPIFQTSILRPTARRILLEPFGEKSREWNGVPSTKCNTFFILPPIIGGNPNMG
jgi:hypothetical protein